MSIAASNQLLRALEEFQWQLMLFANQIFPTLFSSCFINNLDLLICFIKNNHALLKMQTALISNTNLYGLFKFQLKNGYLL